jgi:RNA polymerase sigma-70 factor (ECF subfamily)
VTHDQSRGAKDEGERAGISEAERRERLTQLVLRRSKLSPDEAALLRKVFPAIMDAHHDQVWNLLRKRGLSSHEAEDLRQEVFLALHNHILENGFVANLPGMLHALTVGKVLNHVRAQKRSPLSIGLPSSGSEKPRSQLDVERALHFREVARRIFSQLSPEHREVIDKVVLKGMTHTDAAAALGLPEGTVKSRLIAAKRALLALAEPLLPPSQRGPV